jgi:hypothetical protein
MDENPFLVSVWTSASIKDLICLVVVKTIGENDHFRNQINTELWLQERVFCDAGMLAVVSLSDPIIR